MSSKVFACAVTSKICCLSKVELPDRPSSAVNWDGGLFTSCRSPAIWSWASGRVLRLAESDRAVIPRIRRAEVHVGVRLIACSYTAAAIEGLGVLTDDRLHVTTGDGLSIPAPRGVVIHQGPPRSPVVQIDGVLATAPADTAIDLACAGEMAIYTLAVLDAAMRAGLSHDTLSEAVERARGRRGLVKVRNWLPYADWRSDSPMAVPHPIPVSGQRLSATRSPGSSRGELGWRALPRPGLA